MKNRRVPKLTGYVKVLVNGKNPELFFQKCLAYGITIWDIKKITDTQCEGNIKLRDLHIIKKVKRKTIYKISFTDRRGYPFIMKKVIKRRELLASFAICVLLVLFLSNILWKITITGVSKEMEEKINEQLISYGVNKGGWIFNIDPPRMIQQKLINDLPELLWIGVKQTGTTINLEGVEKVIVAEEISPGPRHLVAAKKGVIKKIFVENGQPNVHVNDVVSPGDILVSGVLDNVGMEESTDQINTDNQHIVAAKASIIAQTWYELTVDIPLAIHQEILTGNQVTKHYVRIGSLQLPIWGFKSPPYDKMYQEMNEKSFYFFKWKLPLHMVESIISEKVNQKMERTKEEAIQIGIKQAKHDLQLEIGPEAKILSEDILHETIENGKVRLHLYITAEEDITKPELIIQGD